MSSYQNRVAEIAALKKSAAATRQSALSLCRQIVAAKTPIVNRFDLATIAKSLGLAIVFSDPRVSENRGLKNTYYIVDGDYIDGDENTVEVAWNWGRR